ncbi:hypothetical protein [Acidiplasma sp.]|uniref:hypothetical protein n=2 Tax=Acidiplasma sp. TaxID=1872114 RepID=UPI00258B60D9|nr:hypothetical protein [Acidiplasma sp.]
MYNLIYIILTEIIMTPLIIWIVDYITKKSSEFTVTAYVISLIFLVMMASMLDALFYYDISSRSFLSVIIAVNIVMDPSTIVLLYAFIKIARSKSVNFSKKTIVNTTTLITWSEVSMAIFLKSLAINGEFIFSGIIDYFSYFGASVTYILFLIPMVSEMIFFVFYNLSGIKRLIGSLLLLMQVADPAMFNGYLEIPLLIAYSIIMFAVLYLLVSYVYKHRQSLNLNAHKMIKYTIILISISVAGIIEPFIITEPFGLSWLLLAVSMLISMFLYFQIVLGYFD